MLGTLERKPESEDSRNRKARMTVSEKHWVRTRDPALSASQSPPLWPDHNGPQLKGC